MNDVGGYFSAAPNGTPRFWGIRLYPGNTKNARATILIHELGQYLLIPNFQQDDAGDPAAGKFNDGLVNSNCRPFIEALP